MGIIIKQPQLYRFLNYCNEYGLEKNVLDCGAGGDCPPLSIFSDFGYKTYAIEISNSQIEKAKIFSIERGEEVIHTYYEIYKAEGHFTDMDIIFKENRILERIYENKK